MESLWAGIVVSRQSHRATEFLLLESRSVHLRYRRSRPQKKFSGGGNKDHPEDLSSIETAIRELYEETGLRPKAGVVPKEIYRVLHKGHLQVFFHLSYDDCEGELRTEELIDGDDILSPPFWVGLEESVWVIYKTHYKALQRAIEHITSLVG